MEQLRKVAVFGGTGFLGRRIVRHLLDHGFAVRVASRHPQRSQQIFQGATAAVESVHADVSDDRSVRAAVADAFAVVNAVSLYVERGDHTFQSVHVEAARRVANHSQEPRVERLVHVSGIGADARSSSRYIRSRGQGEDAVRDAFPAATIIRPAVMFGPDDAFLNAISNLLRTVPAFPMFGRGETRLQPCHVDDAAEAIVRALEAPEPRMIYELGGPRTYTYKGLLQAIGHQLGFDPVLVPLPFGLWHTLAFIAEALPNPPLTRNQVELMAIDTVASADLPGLETLGINPSGIETVLATI